MKEYTIGSLEGKLILFATILASGMAFLDGSVVNIAVPTIQHVFHATIPQIQWVVNGYSLMLCAFILISGALGDRFGRKRIFLTGISLFMLSSFLCGISHSIVHLALFRGLQGIGGAMMTPGSLSILNTSFAESVRGRVIGLWSGFAGGVAILGPFIGGWLVQTLGWQSIFFINLPIGLLALFLTTRFVPESRNNDARNVDILGALLIFLSLFGIAYGLISVSNLGWTNPRIITSLLGGFIIFLLFLFVQKKAKEPLIPFQIFNSLLVTGANLATLFLYFALNGVVFFLVLNFQQIQHYSPIMAGLASLPAPLLITFLSGPGGTLADRIGPRIPMIVGPTIVAVGMASFMLAGKNANYFISFLPGLLLFGFGMAMVIAPLTKSALSVEKKYSGSASSINNAVARFSSLLAIALIGLIVVSLFKQQLGKKISAVNMQPAEKQIIMQQENKLGGIEIPKTFNTHAKTAGQTAIEDSFLFAFRIAMGINASLAFISAVISFFTINQPKKVQVTK